jgi:hypothetical protein
MYASMGVAEDVTATIRRMEEEADRQKALRKAAWRSKPLSERLRLKWQRKSAFAERCTEACPPLSIALYLATCFYGFHTCCGDQQQHVDPVKYD